MNNSRIYFYLVLSFFIYNLYVLWFESYNVNYRVIRKNHHDDRINVSICISIDEIRLKTKLFKYYLIPKNETINSITKFLDALSYSINEFIIQNETAFYIPNALVKNESYLYNNHLCMLINEKKLSIILAFNQFHYKIFVYSQNFHNPFSNYVYYQNKRKIELKEIKALKLKLKNLAYPFTDCIKSPKFKTQFQCINHCLKKKNRKIIYMYESDDLEPLNLTNKKRNLDDEKFCFERCNKRNCYEESLNFVNYASYSSLIVDINLVYNFFFYVVYPSISNCLFHINFIGLIALFLNINFYSNSIIFINLIIKFSYKKFPSNKIAKFFNRSNLKLNFFILITSIIIFQDLANLLISDHYNDIKDPIRVRISEFEFNFQKFDIIICIPIQYILSKHKLPSNQSYPLDLELDKKILDQYTYGELVNLTNNGLKKAIKEAFIRYGTRKQKFNLFRNRSSKVLFRKCSNPLIGGMKLILSRCFRMEIDVKENRYQQLLSISTLEIHLRNYVFDQSIYSIFLSVPDLYFSRKTYQHRNKYKINKKIFKVPDYNLKCNYTDSNFNCNDRFSCIESCINQKFFIKHKSVTTRKVVANRDDLVDVLTKFKKLNKDELNRALLNVKFNDNYIDKKILAECNNKFKAVDCTKTYFLESFKTLHFEPKNFKINIYYEIIKEEEFQPPLWNLILNLISLESIVFGGNLIRIGFILIASIKLIFKIRKQLKILKYLIYLICILGFSIHIYSIFRSIINDELYRDGYVSKNETIQHPTIIFCLKSNHDINLDPNYKMTGNELNELSSKYTYEKVFDRLSFLNSNGTITILTNLTSDLKHDNFKFSTFYYLNLKCFEIINNLIYSESDFIFNHDPYFIKIYFKDNFFDNKVNVYYFCSKDDKKQFNEVYRLELLNDETGKHIYKVKTELLETELNDKYFFIKNPLSLFNSEQSVYNDPKIYIEHMINNFKNQFSLVSSLVPLVDKDYDIEIDDQLFIQYYLQIQNVSDFQTLPNYNYVHQMHNTKINFQFSDKIDNPEFAFSLSFFIYRTLITNRDNYAKLLLNLLNTLSLWLDVCWMDIPIYKIFNFYLLFIKFLDKIRRKLKTSMYYS